MKKQAISGRKIAGSILATFNFVTPTILRPIANIRSEPVALIRDATEDAKKLPRKIAKSSIKP